MTSAARTGSAPRLLAVGVGVFCIHAGALMLMSNPTIGNRLGTLAVGPPAIVMLGADSTGDRTSLREPVPRSDAKDLTKLSRPTSAIEDPSAEAMRRWTAIARRAIKAQIRFAASHSQTCILDLVVRPDGSLIGVSAQACSLELSERDALLSAAYLAAPFGTPPYHPSGSIPVDLQL
jgi:hypothetical protein